MEYELPNKPSDILAVALVDFRAVKKQPEYVINMDYWHEGERYDNRCLVCLAGSVIANSLATFFEESLTCLDFAEPTRGKLKFLDGIREGALVDYGCKYAEAISETMMQKLSDAVESHYQNFNKSCQNELGHTEIGETFEQYLEETVVLLKQFGV